jgi:hypothetical protein
LKILLSGSFCVKASLLFFIPYFQLVLKVYLRLLIYYCVSDETKSSAIFSG